MASPRLPPAASPGAPREPPAEVADAWILGDDAERPQASADVHGRSQTPADVRGRLRGAKVQVTREGGRERARMTVYLRPETRALLARVCAADDREASAVVDEAVRALLRGR